MEQNLDKRERCVRLIIGLIFAVGATLSVIRAESIYLAVGLGLASLGFIANYFTCFCGIKSMVSRLKS